MGKIAKISALFLGLVTATAALAQNQQNVGPGPQPMPAITTGDVVTGTGSGIGDSAVLLTSLAPLANPTFSGTVTLPNSPRILGSSTGYTSLTSANSGASNFTLTLPAVTDTVAVLGTAQTFTAAQTNSTAGAASTPAMTYSGTPYAGGSTTTNFPLLYFNNGASGPTTFSAGGTFLGFNGPSGFAGNYIDVHTNGGGSIFSVNSVGTPTTSSGYVTTGNAMTMSGNRSAAAWTTSGKGFVQQAATWTDTTSSGTIAAEYINAILAPTLVFSSATTVTNPYNTYFVAPVCSGGTGGNKCTATNGPWALGADSAQINGALTVTSTVTMTGFTTNTAGSAVCILGTNVLTTAAVAACTGVSTKMAKHDIHPIASSALIDLMKVNFDSFRFNKGVMDGGRSVQYGPMAEDLAKAFPVKDFPDLVLLDAKGKPHAINWQGLDTGVVPKAVQEMQAEIVALKSANDDLEKRIARLERRR